LRANSASWPRRLSSARGDPAVGIQPSPRIYDVHYRGCSFSRYLPVRPLAPRVTRRWPRPFLLLSRSRKHQRSTCRTRTTTPAFIPVPGAEPRTDHRSQGLGRGLDGGICYYAPTDFALGIEAEPETCPDPGPAPAGVSALGALTRARTCGTVTRLDPVTPANVHAASSWTTTGAVLPTRLASSIKNDHCYHDIS